MPPLPREPNVFPADLLAEEAAPDGGERCWWVLHTKPRQEKSLARQMLTAEVPFYLPLVPRRTLVRGRPLEAHVPLFPGYLFLLADRDERVTALATERVVRSLAVADQSQLRHDLWQVHRLIAAGAPITPEQRLAPGATVEVRSGPLAGLRGRIIRGASGRRFVVRVDFIQQGASVLLDDFNLVAVEAAEQTA
ncbi:MAG TPA: transcription termination/antitermination NusG family protein [Gemmataceae bacterium]|jgi:transcriptional antiterminator RfaH|nr:transcription termination/antitermination NusG family protein [Gemmataceae bacterium]